MADFDVKAAIDRVWADPEGTAATLLRCAEDLFAERGFDGVGVRDIAAAAGVNVATVHFHWRNKQTLYECVHTNLDLYLLGLMARLNREAEREGLDLDGQIERWVDLSLEVFLTRPTAARLTLQYLARQAPPESPGLLKHEVAVGELFESEIARRLPDGGAGLDIPLMILCTTYYGLVTFCDSPFQRALLGGSVYASAELQQRLRTFGVRLLQALVRTD